MRTPKCTFGWYTLKQSIHAIPHCKPLRRAQIFTHTPRNARKCWTRCQAATWMPHGPTWKKCSWPLVSAARRCRWRSALSLAKISCEPQPDITRNWVTRKSWKTTACRNTAKSESAPTQNWDFGWQRRVKINSFQRSCTLAITVALRCTIPNSFACEQVREVLNSKADPNWLDESGSTALMHAVNGWLTRAVCLASILL